MPCVRVGVPPIFRMIRGPFNGKGRKFAVVDGWWMTSNHVNGCDVAGPCNCSRARCPRRLDPVSVLRLPISGVDTHSSAVWLMSIRFVSGGSIGFHASARQRGKRGWVSMPWCASLIVTRHLRAAGEAPSTDGGVGGIQGGCEPESIGTSPIEIWVPQTSRMGV